MKTNPPLFNKVTLGLSVVILMAILAVMAFVASIWGESKTPSEILEGEEMVSYVADDGVEVPENGVLEVGTMIQTSEAQEVGIFFGEADLLRLAANTTVTFDEVDLEVSPMVLTVSLSAGSVWVSDLQGVADFEVNTERVRVEPENGSVAVDYEEGSVNVFAAHHPTRVSFLSEIGEEEQTVLNSYLLTESHETTISENAMSGSLDQLRYTKLTKEYPFVFVEDDQWLEIWETMLDSDEDRLADVYTTFVSSLRRYGTPGYDEESFHYRFRSFYRMVRSWLTFSDHHLNEVEENEDLDLFLQALYLFLHDEESEAMDRLALFEKEAADFENLEKLESLDRVLQSVYPGDLFYPAKESIRSIQENAVSADEALTLQLSIVRERLNEVYDLLDRGDISEAKQALYDYGDEWQAIIASAGSDLSEVVRRLTAERQILQNLLYREDTFYEVAAYEVLSTLEDKILTLTAEEYDLNEERQAFIQDKIRVLMRLVELIDEGFVGVSEGTDLANLLIGEADDLLDDVTSEAAVNAYFESKLEEVKYMFEFINSPDFALAVSGTFEERFEAYLDKESELKELTEYILGLSGEEEEVALTLEEAQAEAEAAFKSAGIGFTSLIPLGDTGYRLFNVMGGHVGLIEFDGNYDRVTQIIYDLEVEGEMFSTGLKLEDLRDAVEEAVAEQEEAEEDAATSDNGSERTLTALESFAIGMAYDDLTEQGIDLTEEEIDIVDLDRNQFFVSTTIEYGESSIAVEFLYLGDEYMATEIVGEVDGELFLVDDLPVSELQDAVNDEWELIQLNEE